MAYPLNHIPVMLKEVEKYLITDIGGKYVDCTFGGGGHSKYLLEKYPGLSIIGLDCDICVINSVTDDRLRIFKENFKNLRKLLSNLNIDAVNGVLIDLGVSSMQFDNLERGFSFNSSNLDMRMDSTLDNSAIDLINNLPENELADIFYKFGEERLSRVIARRIVKERLKEKITSGQVLSSIVSSVKHRRGKCNPATQVFQALRIAVNNELENLTSVLHDMPDILKPGARIVILSYHSLEDRIIKYNFKDAAKSGKYNILTKKVIFPSDEEIRSNPRSRSAKLRASEKI